MPNAVPMCGLSWYGWQVKSSVGYLFPKDFKVPKAYLGVEHGGILNWTVPAAADMPVYAAQLAAAQDYLTRMGLHAPSALAEQGNAQHTVCISLCNTFPPGLH